MTPWLRDADEKLDDMADGSRADRRPTPPRMDLTEERTPFSVYNPRALFKDCKFFIQAPGRDDPHEEMVFSELRSTIKVSRESLWAPPGLIDPPQRPLG
jgi:hypothetical protein